MSSSISNRVREALLMAALFGSTQITSAQVPAPSTGKPSDSHASAQLVPLELTRIS